jgi:hypothetical protein
MPTQATIFRHVIKGDAALGEIGFTGSVTNREHFVPDDGRIQYSTMFIGVIFLLASNAFALPPLTLFILVSIVVPTMIDGSLLAAQDRAGRLKRAAL